MAITDTPIYRRWGLGLCFLVLSSFANTSSAALTVIFDFPHVVECFDVTPPEWIEQNRNEKIIQAELYISVRFHGNDQQDVEEITIEVDASDPELLVHNFSPTTLLASALTKDIETTTVSEKTRSLDASLGGVLPVPTLGLVAHVTPTIRGDIGKREVATEKLSRLPPKQVLVVSGTSHRGHGVFFKLKRNSQLTLEGVHKLVVTFLVPSEWQGDTIHLACTAHGHRKVLWLDQSKIWGHTTASIEIEAPAENEKK